MNRKIILSALMFGVILIAGCLPSELSYEDLKLKELKRNVTIPGCSVWDMRGDLLTEGVAVRTQEEYDSLINSFYAKGYQIFQLNIESFPVTYMSLPKYNYSQFFDVCNVFPAIDFSQKTLLAKYTMGGGCSVDFVKKVYRDDSNKKLIYSINVVEKGGCEMARMSMNWVLVPKVPSDYTIDFEVK